MRATSPARAVVLVVRDRDGWACVRCGATSPLTTQHRHARAMGGTRDPRVNEPDNLVTLCGSGTTGCHGWVEHHPRAARQLGLALSSWEPTSTPVVAHDGVWLLDRQGSRVRIGGVPGDAGGLAGSGGRVWGGSGDGEVVGQPWPAPPAGEGPSWPHDVRPH